MAFCSSWHIPTRPGFSHRTWGSNPMARRARPRGPLGFALFALGIGAAGAIPASAADKPIECVSCHEQGQKLEKSAHAGLTCDTCHESHEKFPHPDNIAKPQCITCHQDQADKYADSVH